ncbi:hypothetical protein Fcan01_17737 [Folsomia candida]|uniref:Uncharacterized protein n=1 Tax=Folsomia candida TaxID=158441 RepID=A0A226DQU8_FOLCA|nr:hypothetical protein Fcan01_17737 [Folsomia candida]
MFPSHLSADCVLLHIDLIVHKSIIIFCSMPIPNWKMEIIEEIFGLFDPCLIDSIILSHRQEQICLSFLPIDARFGLRGSFGRRGMAQRQLYLRVGKLKKILLSYGITGKFFE